MNDGAGDRPGQSYAAGGWRVRDGLATHVPPRRSPGLLRSGSAFPHLARRLSWHP
ncbi:hypothetical protein Save01_00996 [Streptomyces avermitilis]